MDDVRSLDRRTMPDERACPPEASAEEMSSPGPFTDDASRAAGPAAFAAPAHSAGLSAPATADGPVYALVDEFWGLIDRGEQIGIETFVGRHPDYAGRLRELLMASRALATLGVPSGSNDAVLRQGVLPFRELGDFRLVREIGRGGMGVVYEAEQLSLGRRVALKVLPFAAVLDARHLQRFKNEARSAATLDHPHIVPVYSVGEAQGIHYYAMRLVEGESLAEMIARLGAGGRRAASISTAIQTQTTGHAGHCGEYFRQAARWGIQAALALDHAHRCGIVHRDVKPSNLLIDADGSLCVADFGLATRGAAGELTTTGDVLGTLRYMSPEQARGDRAILDQRADVYSLGVTLFELLTLEPAFPQSDRRVLLEQVLSDARPAPRGIRPEIPGDLDTIVRKAMEREPRDRYATAACLARDLQRFLDCRPIEAVRPPLGERIVKWGRRHRELARSLALAAALVAVSAGVAASLIIHERHQTEIERIGRAAVGRLAEAGRRNTRLHEYVTRINLADRALFAGQLAEARVHLRACIPREGTEDFRGFEWRYLTQIARTRAETGTVLGRHETEINSLCVAPHGRHVASCGRDALRLWDVKSGRLLAAVHAHDLDVDHSCFSPDGALLATAGDDHTIKIWSIPDLEPVRLLPISGIPVGIAFACDGTQLVLSQRPENDAAARDGSLPSETHVWETRSWNELGRYRDHPGAVCCSAALSPDGYELATGDQSGTLALRDLRSGAIRWKTAPFADGEPWAIPVRWVAFGGRQNWMAVGGASRVRIVQLNNGALVGDLWDRS